jgi:beta-glucanase (GH16 family)
MHYKFFSILALITVALPLPATKPLDPRPAAPADAVSWQLIWSDEFNGSGAVSSSDWIYDTGTGYGCSGCPSNWGTGEIEVMSSSTNNVFQSVGNLNIRALHSGSNPTSGWTSGRIETARTDFQPPAGGVMAIEARIQQPNVDTTNGLGYWPAFWTLGAPFRGNYLNWPGIGELDIMEDINGRSSEFATLHCGSSPGGPCNEFTGKSSGERVCAGCQTSFHTYRMEFDKSSSLEEIRWYLDGAQFFSIKSNEVDSTTWNNATNHGFFIILDLAMGGGFPAAFGGGPTSATVSGATMLVDYVRVYYSSSALGATKTGVFRPSTGELFLKNANSSGFADTYIIFGNPGDYPLAGDWNGDGIDSIGIYRNGVFYLRDTNSTGFADIVVPFGSSGDQPIAGDWNGDGVDTIGVYRNGTFYLRNSNTAGSPDLVFTLGNPGDVGIAGDWNGDGITTCGVFRPSNGIVYLRNSNTTGFADLSFVFGNAGDKPVAGDWNGDGIDTIGIYRNGVFYLSNSNATGFADIVFVLGNSGDSPIAGNWNGSP